MESEVHSFYGNKTRVRVCGICQTEDTVLLINHLGISRENFWAPPGGGLNFGETAEQCLTREFLEETGLQIRVREFLFVCELIRHPLHAIELFFRVEPLTSDLKTGSDPEPASPSIIKEVKYMSWEEITTLPGDQVHGIFRYTDHPSKVAQLSGFFKL